MLVLCLFAIADMFVLGAALSDDMDTGSALLLHLGISVAALIQWWISGQARRLAPVLGMALGPVILLSTMFLPSIGRLARYRPFLADRQASQIQQARTGARAMVARFLDGRVRHPDTRSLGSLIDIFQYGDVDNRRAALETSVRSFDPRLSPVIAKALTDEDQTIRALAAAATNRIAQKLAEARQDFAAALASGDGDTVDRLRPLLLDHSQFDVLMSDTQRHQIAADVGIADSDREGALLQAIQTSWAIRDWTALDRLCAQTDGYSASMTWRVRSAARWWAGQASC